MKPVVFAVALAAAVPGDAAVLFRQTVTAVDGIAELSDSSDLPALLVGGTTWVGISSGTLAGGSWEVEGELAKSWWDPMGGGFDENGEPIPALTGNEYLFIPGCTAAAGQPAQCLGTPLTAQVVDNLFRVEFYRPADTNTCTPTFTGDTSDCAFSYRFDRANYALRVLGAGEVTFTFYDEYANEVPEPASWALLVGGFAMAGGALRQRRHATA